MNISLTTELDSFVHEKVESGLYQSAREVIGEGLRLLKEQDDLSRARLAQLVQEIDLGINQMERGQASEHAADQLPAVGEAIKAAGRQRRATLA